MQSQQIEVVGRAAFIARAVQENLEVAVPERDCGIDLLVYGLSTFKALPIQLKVNAPGIRRFGLHRKYESQDKLVLAYVWLEEPGKEHQIALMTYGEAYNCLGTAVTTPSWLNDGSYTFSNISIGLAAQLKSYNNRWDWLKQQLF